MIVSINLQSDTSRARTYGGDRVPILFFFLRRSDKQTSMTSESNRHTCFAERQVERGEKSQWLATVNDREDDDDSG